MGRAQSVKLIKEKDFNSLCLHDSLSSMGALIADVVILSNIPKVLSYSIPNDVSPKVGLRVAAPVRKSTRVGVIIGIRESSESDEGLKDLACALDEIPFIAPELIELISWTSKYYHAGIGPCMALAFPPYLRQCRTIILDEDPVIFRTDRENDRLGPHQKSILDAIPNTGIRMSTLKDLLPGITQKIKALAKRGFIELKEVPCSSAPSCSATPEYTPDQHKAISEITQAIKAGRFHAYVLHGITGSGKTEVYLATAMEAIKLGKSVLYLVPEIALTPQTIDMVKSRIPLKVAVFHSGLSPKDRAREFMKVAREGVKFVLGTRSAIFSPLREIGLIVVDEEHDSSYKQEDGVPYNARDLSLLRAKNNSAVVILGSATPSMETYDRTRLPHSSLITMTSRIGPAKLPEVEIVDMRGIQGPLSDRLIREMIDTISKGEQVLLFINRRGFSAALVCPGCGKVLKCSRCDRSLTYHKAKGKALCHWCGFTMNLPEICPSCGCLDMKPIGMGTEQVIQAVQKVSPGKRVLQIDSDEMTTVKKLTAALDAIRAGSVDIIVGTQMIAKGHDFPLLTLVGVVYAEQLLYMPDFRSGERTFQQIVQVAGRAGRRKSDTKVIIQTYVPDHPLIQSICGYDYQAMMEIERGIRKATSFPPYSHMARCVVSSKKDKTAREFSFQLALSVNIPGVEALGPAPAPIALLRDHFRWHFILRSKNRGALHKAIDIIERMHQPQETDLKIDVDPYSMM
jgi:primosomal protein N' (replication factor Y)